MALIAGHLNAGVIPVVFVVVVECCFTSTETIMLIRNGEKGGGIWRGGRGRLYTYRYTVTTRMTLALRWAAMRAISCFINCEGQSHKTDCVHKPQPFLKRKESQSEIEPMPFCLPA